MRVKFRNVIISLYAEPFPDMMALYCIWDGVMLHHHIISRQWRYRKNSGISRTKSQNLKCFLYLLAVVFAQTIEAMCSDENEDAVGAAPTGDAPTTSELSEILLPTEVWLILEFLR